MRSRLGSANLALLSLYFAPVWGVAAVRALISPYFGLDDKAHATAAIYFGRLFDLGDGGLILTAQMLAGIKLVIAASFLAYLIEFARALAMGRDADPETTDVTLTLAVVGIALWAVPALLFQESVHSRLYATQVLMLAGAIFVVVVERHVEGAKTRSSAETTDRGRNTLELPVGTLAEGPAPAQTAAAMARIPEIRLRPPGY